MNIPTKLLSQLQELFKGKYVEYYVEITPLSTSRQDAGVIYNGYYNGLNTIMDQTASVKKMQREMKVEDLFNTADDKEQTKLRYLYMLEKESEELRKLKASMEHLKSVFVTKE